MNTSKFNISKGQNQIQEEKKNWLRQYIQAQSAIKLELYTGAEIQPFSDHFSTVDESIRPILQEILLAQDHAMLFEMCYLIRKKNRQLPSSCLPLCLLHMHEKDWYPFGLLACFRKHLPNFLAQKTFWKSAFDKEATVQFRFYQAISDPHVDIVDPQLFSAQQRLLLLQTLHTQDQTKALGFAQSVANREGLAYELKCNPSRKQTLAEWGTAFLSNWSTKIPESLLIKDGQKKTWPYHIWLLGHLHPAQWTIDIADDWGLSLPLSPSKQRDVVSAYGIALKTFKCHEIAKEIWAKKGFSIPDYVLGDLLTTMDTKTYNLLLAQQVQQGKTLEEVLLWIDKSKQAINPENGTWLQQSFFNEMFGYDNMFQHRDFRKSFLHLMRRMPISVLTGFKQIPIEDFKYERTTYTFIESLYNIIDKRLALHNIMTI